MKEFLERIKWARFTTTDEIFENRERIRNVVQQFDNDTLEVYQWYFFRQLCLLKNPLKDLLWNYLVKDIISIEDESKLTDAYKHYKEKCLQILQYQKKKDKEKGVTQEQIDPKPKITITCVEDLFKI